MTSRKRPSVSSVIGSVRMIKNRPHDRVDDREQHRGGDQRAAVADLDPRHDREATQRPSATIAARMTKPLMTKPPNGRRSFRRPAPGSPRGWGDEIDARARCAAEFPRPTRSPCRTSRRRHCALCRAAPKRQQLSRAVRLAHAGRVKRPLGDLFGLANFGVNLTTLRPGAVSALRHAHAKQDEFVYMLEGRPTLSPTPAERRWLPAIAPASRRERATRINSSTRRTRMSSISKSATARPATPGPIPTTTSRR